MRRGSSLLLPLLFAAACRTQDVAPPEMRRPIEALPRGARAVLLTTDLQNTWQRIESLQLDEVVARWPTLAEALRNPDFVQLREAYLELERRSGASLKNDVLLNVAGRRSALGLYADSSGDRDHDVLLVAELQDAARFRTALDGLRSQASTQAGDPTTDQATDPTTGESDGQTTGQTTGQATGQATAGEWILEDATFDGAPALRLRHAGDTDLLLVQRDDLLVASTRDELVRLGLALHAAGGEDGALREPAFATALRAVGPQNVVLLAPTPGDETRWTAQGFTWDRAGLHFESMHAVANPVTESTPANRDAILGSIPDGMTLAAYVRTPNLDLKSLFEDFGLGRQAASGPLDPGSTAASASMPGLPFLPGNAPEWAGDEAALALLGVEATPLAPIPNVAIVLEVRDAQAAARGMEELEAMLAQMPVGPAARGFESVTYGGTTYRTLVQPLSEKVSPSYLVDGEVAIVSTTRALLQQIIDTRRTGRRSVLTDRAFKRFDSFVPPDAAMVLYADQKRLHAAAKQLGRAASTWGPEVERGVVELERVSALLEHFPAGAAYVTREADHITLRGWMVEAD